MRLGTAIAISGYVDITESVQCDRIGTIFIIARPVIRCYPQPAPIFIVLDCRIVKAAVVVIALARYIDITEIIQYHSMNFIITIARIIIPCHPLLYTIRIILYRGIIGVGSVAIATSRHVNIAESIHGDRPWSIMIIARAVIPCHPLLVSIRVVLCCGVVSRTLDSMT